MDTGNETVVEVVLELADGTEPSVELGSNRRVSVTIITVDICSTPTGEWVTKFSTYNINVLSVIVS